MSILGVLILATLLGLIPASVASSKGRSFVGWWIYGALLFIVALPHALMLRNDQAAIDRRAVESGEMRKCPSCAEMVRRDAKICRYCQRELPEIKVTATAIPNTSIVG